MVVGYSTPKMDVYSNGKVITYKITSTDDFGNLTSSSGRITIKKNDLIVWSGTIYSITGVYQSNFTTTGPGVYKIIYIEDGTSKVARATVTITTIKKKTNQTNATTDNNANKKDVTIFSLQNPLCYGIVLVLIILLIYILYSGFKPPKKKTVFKFK